MKKRSTMDYYKKNPKAYAKKKEYELERQKDPKIKRKRNEIAKAKRARGLEGKMGNRDMSHTKDGRLVVEHRSKNRARNGEGGRRKLK